MAEDGMSLSERRRYKRQTQPRYRGATKKEKQALLDEMEQVTGLHSKSLTRLINARDECPKRPRRRARRRKYGADVQHVVGLVWESLDGICAERLTPALGTLSFHLKAGRTSAEMLPSKQNNGCLRSLML